MSSILRMPFDRPARFKRRYLSERRSESLADPDTVTLIERPYTVPLATHVVPTQQERSWEERVKAECDRTPTLDFETHRANESDTSVETNAAQPAAPITAPTPPAPAVVSVAVPVTTPATTTATAPTVLRGRYQLLRPLAAGGGAVIYRARDLQRDDATEAAVIAVKLLKPECRNEAAAIERLKREYAYSLKLLHSNVVRVFDLDKCEQHGWFMTMELLDGDSLATAMRRTDTQMSKHRRLNIIEACGRALTFAHQHGVMHCDFKPSNVMLAGERICVLDFGAATVVQDINGDKYKAAALTPAYASPQIIKGEYADARDDLFSLACVAYELLSGQRPFGRKDNAQPARPEPLVRPPHLSRTQWLALQQALSYERDKRQPSVAAFLKAFTAHPQRVAWWLGAAGVALVVFGAALAFTTTSNEHAVSQSVPSGANVGAIASHAIAPVAESSTTSSTSDTTAIRTDTLVPTLNMALRLPLTLATLTPRTSAATAERARSRAVEATRSTAPTISFEQTHVSVSDRAIAAALTLTRENADDDQRVRWRTIDGSAHAGIDYDPVVANATFLKRQTRRTLFVNIKQNAAAQGDRNFIIEVGDGGRSKALRATVTIKHSLPPET